MFGYRNNENNTKYSQILLFWVYDLNQIALFLNKRFLLFMRNLRSSITMASIAYMTLIISPQKEKKIMMCAISDHGCSYPFH